MFRLLLGEVQQLRQSQTEILRQLSNESPVGTGDAAKVIYGADTQATRYKLTQARKGDCPLLAEGEDWFDDSRGTGDRVVPKYYPQRCKEKLMTARRSRQNQSSSA